MKVSEKSKYLRKAGDLASLYGIKDITYNSGRAKGIQAFEVKNGNGLSLSVFADRGLDIPNVEFLGQNIGLLTKSGISSPFSHNYSSDGVDSFLRQFSGGFLTTCGLTYSGAACMDEGQLLPLHGRYSNTIAEKVYVTETEENDEVVLKICGDVREACLFGENLILHREIKIYTEKNLIKLCDVVENLGFRPSPVMLVYHVNFGYPLLDSETKLYFSADVVEPQSEVAKQGMNKYFIVEEPEDVREEQCYYHMGQRNPENSYAVIHNEKLGIAVAVKYDANQLPIMCEWKSMQAGDYAVGLEPTTNGTKGRASARTQGNLCELQGQEKCRFDIEFYFMNDIEEIRKWCHACKESNIE